jgi:hypothetical protein
VSGGGADVPENVLPRDQFLDEVAARGLDIRHEWHDDFREVTGKQPLEGEHA